MPSRRLIKQIVTFLVFVLALVVAKLPYKSYVVGAYTDMKTALRPQGVIISERSAEFVFPLTLDLTGVGIQMPIAGLPFPLFVDKATVSGRLAKLLLLQGAAALTFEAYSGKGQIDFSQSLVSSGQKTSVSLDNLDLARHPVAAAVSLEGLLSATFTGELSRPSGAASPVVETANLSLEIADGALRGQPKIAGLIQIPIFEKLGLKATADKTGPRINLKSASLDSSLGKASASGKLDLDATQRNVNTVDITAKISLTDEGKTKLGGYLALAARIPIEQAGNDWSVTVIKVPGQNVKTAVIKEG